MGSRRSLLWILLPLLLAVFLPRLLLAPSAQYLTDVSFDFLSADELANWANATLAGAYASGTTTTITVSGGKLNITNTGTSDALLILEKRAIIGYAEITIDQGEIFVLSNYNGSPSSQFTGYVVKKDANGITVYTLNGTTKSAVASVTSTATKVVVTVEEGKFRVDLSDGTGVYEGSINHGVLALGAEPSAQCIVDKVVLYKKVFTAASGEKEIDLGTQTIIGRAPVSFSYDLSGFSSIQSAKLVVKLSTSDDPYFRYFAVKINNRLIDKVDDWDNYDESMGGSSGVVYGSGTKVFDITQDVQSAKTGTIKVAVSSAKKYSWTCNVKIIVTGSSGSQQDQQQQGGQEQEVTIIKQLEGKEKYLLYGLGALVLILLIVVLTQPQGRRKGLLGAFPILTAILVFFLVLGGIVAAALAIFHPEYLNSLALGLGAIAIIVLFMLLQSGKRIPNPVTAVQG